VKAFLVLAPAFSPPPHPAMKNNLLLLYGHVLKVKVFTEMHFHSKLSALLEDSTGVVSVVILPLFNIAV